MTTKPFHIRCASMNSSVHRNLLKLAFFVVFVTCGCAGAYAFSIGPAPGLNCVVSAPYNWCPVAAIVNLNPGSSIPYKEVHQLITQNWLEPLSFPPPSGPVHFLPAALRDIEEGNKRVDYLQSDHAKHFDNNFFPQGALRLIKGRDQILALLRTTTPTIAQAAMARRLLGSYLHTVQDFFAHSTWINGSPSIASLPKFGKGPVVGPGPGNACLPLSSSASTELSFPPFTGMLVGSGTSEPLASGFVVGGEGFRALSAALAPNGQCAHGFVNTGIHKDWPGRPLHEEAAIWAGVATASYVSEILDASANYPDSVCMFMTDMPCPCKATPTDASLSLIGPFQFDGSSIFINEGGFGRFGTGPFSLVAWVNWNVGGSAINNIFRKSNYPPAGSGSGYWIRITRDLGLLEFFVGETTGSPANAPRASISTAIGPNSWHQVVGTKDASGNMTLYMDGQGVGGTFIDPTFDVNSASPFTLGAWDDRFGPTEFFAGSMQNITVFNRALTAAEVQSLYGAGSGQCP